MALLKGGGFNEGSLLRRTLLHIGTFAVGTAAFVAIVSFVLVTAAKSLLPSHGAKADSATKKDDTAASSGFKRLCSAMARSPDGVRYTASFHSGCAAMKVAMRSRATPSGFGLAAVW